MSQSSPPAIRFDGNARDEDYCRARHSDTRVLRPADGNRNHHDAGYQEGWEQAASKGSLKTTVEVRQDEPLFRVASRLPNSRASASDGFGPEGIATMRELLFILGLGLLVIWDVTQNHSGLLDALASVIRHLLGLVGRG